MPGFKDSRFEYRPTRLRVMHYTVTDKATGQELGTVYRDTGTTWAAADLEGKQTIDHYPGSRDVAAGSLETRQEEGIPDMSTRPNDAGQPVRDDKGRFDITSQPSLHGFDYAGKA